MPSRHLIFLLSFVSMVLSCRAEPTASLVNGVQVYEASLKHLKEYCEKWANEYDPISAEELAKREPWVQDVYAIFEDFWTPVSPEKLSTEDADGVPHFYGNFQYLILQRSVAVSQVDADDIHEGLRILEIMGALLDEEDGPEELGVITDFRPRVSFEGRKVLPLTAKREKELLAFLGDESYPAGTGNIMRPAMAKGISRQRMNYLLHYLRVIYGHWGGWHLISHPEVHRVTFNRGGNSALVEFRFGYKGGSALYEKANDEWRFVESEFTWVE